MKKALLLSIFSATMAMTTFAQLSTARKFLLPNSDDKKSEITVYLPTAEAAEKANGRVIVDCPGGGYSHLASDHEGHHWANFYNEQGIAFVVVKYRMPNGDRNIPLGDVYNAIKTVRDSAEVWHINPHNVGIQGFSAGGHLASAVSTHAPFNVRPDFSILFYPVISMVENISHKGSVQGFLGEGRKDPAMQKEWSSDQAVQRHLTPPAIIIMTNDDKVVPPATNGAAYYTAMRRNGNDCSLFCYPYGGHGFGFRDTWKYHELMKAELKQWLDDLKMPAKDAVKVACIGNSITDGHGIDMAEIFGYPARLGKMLGDGYAVKNFGVSARTMSVTGDRPYVNEPAWKACKEWNPDVVVIKLGTNDTKEHNWATAKADFEKSLKQITDELKALPTPKRFILCAPIASGDNRYGIRDSITVNEIIPIIKKFAKKNKMEYLDLHTEFGDLDGVMLSDMVHPNEKGVTRMAEIVKKAIVETKK